MIVFALTALTAFALWKSSSGYITYIEVRLPLEGERSPPGSPWPLPKSWKSSQELLTLDSENFYISSNAADCDVIDEGIRRYKKIVVTDRKGRRKTNLSVLEGLQVKVQSDFTCGYPKHGEDESYELDVPVKGPAMLHSNTTWGALRGLETFSQLVYLDENGNYLINSSFIDDAPRYKYRGMLLDTARHFQPVKTLKKNLDAMAYNKFNAFHWHIVDDQSWPFESKVFPNLTKLAAYSPKHVYTQENIRDIIQYARLRGIRVIPEFDTPGHTQAFGKAFPWLLTPCYGEGPEHPYTPNHPEHAAAEFLNPMLEDTYTVFNAIVKEVKSVFADEYIHLGMDEVYYACWKSSPADLPWNNTSAPQLPLPHKLSSETDHNNFSSNFDPEPKQTFAYDNPGSQISSSGDFAHVPLRSSLRGKYGHRRTPSNVSNASNASSNINPSFHSDEVDELEVSNNQLLKSYHSGRKEHPPDRPSTLDLPGSRLPPLPRKSSLGRTSPKQWTAFSNSSSPGTPSDESSGSTSASRVRFSIDENGSYINRIVRADEEKTLLDLPVDGQSQDGTVPLSVTFQRGSKQRQVLNRNWERNYLA